MRIAQVNDVASVASELTRGLRARGHDVELLQPRLIGGLLPGPLKPIVAPLRAVDLALLARRLAAGRFDVLHIHYAYLGVLAMAARRPFIVHVHGADVYAVTPGTGGLVRRALRDAAHVFYSTPDLTSYTLPYRAGAEFLPNPVDIETFRPASPASAHDGVYIACGLTDLKGAGRILEAVRQLAVTHPGIRFTGIEGGRYAPDFAALPNVTLLPFQRRADLPALIDRHGIVLGQTNLGAAGMAEHEAMACARPVVSHFTFAGAYPDEPPFLGAATPEEIAAHVVRLAGDASAREREGEASRTWVSRYHELGAVTARVEAVLEAVVSAHPR